MTMVALPDFEREFTHAPLDYLETASAQQVEASAFDLGRATQVLCGSALVCSSLGLWLVSMGAQDAAMMMIKLLFSVTLLFAGLMCLSRGHPEQTEPDIQVDVMNRRLHVIAPLAGGRAARVAVHDLDTLSELSMRDRVLTARDATGRQIVAMKIEDRATARALRRALGFAA
ncbi:hypothetical protein [Roseovarius sp. 217]|uniref:hypothetical protein n=1 Tax=Roseovarius sp. (strain 217) TaxID=314264 RepID=UPI0000687257|nr:hypothetical protein [Roseovarius sp. 217]EAQ23249.1 hypothetical protein ROS217_18292 [Roseovarius sp. 217]